MSTKRLQKLNQIIKAEYRQIHFLNYVTAALANIITSAEDSFP